MEVSIVPLKQKTKETLQQIFEVGNQIQMHSVAVTWISPVSNEDFFRTGYFPEKTEANIFAENISRQCEEMGLSYLVFIDGSVEHSSVDAV